MSDIYLTILSDVNVGRYQAFVCDGAVSFVTFIIGAQYRMQNILLMATIWEARLKTK
jgi:hypothetical protein